MNAVNVVLVDGRLTAQCRGVHDHDGAIWHCQAPVGHDGAHRDYEGREWTGGTYWQVNR